MIQKEKYKSYVDFLRNKNLKKEKIKKLLEEIDKYNFDYQEDENKIIICITK